MNFGRARRTWPNFAFARRVPALFPVWAVQDRVRGEHVSEQFFHLTEALESLTERAEMWGIEFWQLEALSASGVAIHFVDPPGFGTSELVELRLLPPAYSKVGTILCRPESIPRVAGEQINAHLRDWTRWIQQHRPEVLGEFLTHAARIADALGDVSRTPTAKRDKGRKYKWPWLAKALELVKDDPFITDAEVARRLQIAQSQLSRCELYRRFKAGLQEQARKAALAGRPAGFVVADDDGGRLEAVDESDPGGGVEL